jgi:phenylpropionate dioxygenase-like ring-hydroxylating dioxygenase large terminal subunit
MGRYLAREAGMPGPARPGSTDAPAWTPVLTSDQVTSTPVSVGHAGRDWVLVRLAPADTVSVFPSHCPHRLVPLAAASVIDGQLQCRYHGWRFDTAGTCTAVPSAPEGSHVPPRAHVADVPRVRETNGMVWLAEHGDPPVRSQPEPELLRNEDLRLSAAWHPVALVTEVTADPVDVRLLGQTWSLRRTSDGALAAEPRPHGLTQRWGLVWLAPEQPRAELFDDPDEEDASYVGEWLRPLRTPVAAGLTSDNFLDVAHFPFVHAGTFGAGSERVVRDYDVELGDGGFRSVQVQPFDNPEDPGVARGERPVRQTRRATYVYRAPFQLMLRLEELEAGATKTILFFAQPEEQGSTRLYTKMLLRGIGGVARPGADVVAREVAFEDAVLAEDLALQQAMDTPGLPLDLPHELHVRADRLGVALRRTLRAWLDEGEATP